MSERSGGCSDIAPDDARTDQRMRIDVRVTEKLARDPRRNCTSAPVLRLQQRRAACVDFIGKHPQVAGATAPILAALASVARGRYALSRNLRIEDGCRFTL